MGHELLQEQPCLLGHQQSSQSCANAAVRALRGQIQKLKGLGTGTKTQLRGGFVALLGNFSPDKIISPSVFLEEAGEKCGKSLQEHGYLLQLMLQCF